MNVQTRTTLDQKMIPIKNKQICTIKRKNMNQNTLENDVNGPEHYILTMLETENTLLDD